MQVNQNVNALNFVQAGSGLKASAKATRPGEGKEGQDFASFLGPAQNKGSQGLSDFNGSEKNKIQKKPDIETTEAEKPDIKNPNAIKQDNAPAKQAEDAGKTEKSGQQDNAGDNAVGTDIVPDGESMEMPVKEDGPALTEEETEAVLETISQLLQAVMEQFGLTGEEFAGKLESFGMKPEELFTPAGVKTFFLNMENAEPCDLLVDEGLNLKFNDFAEVINKEMEALDLPQEAAGEFAGNHDLNEILTYGKDNTSVLDGEKAIPDTEKTVSDVLDNNDSTIFKTAVTNEPEVIVNGQSRTPVEDAKEPLQGTHAQGHDVKVANQDVQVSGQDVQASNQDAQVPDKDVWVPNQDVHVSEQDVQASDKDMQAQNQDGQMPNRNNQMQNQDGQMQNDDKHALEKIADNDEQHGNILMQNRQELSFSKDLAPKDDALPEIQKPDKAGSKNFFENSILQSINESFNKITEIPAAEEAQISSRQIIEQIVEQVKAEVNQNTSSLELQLYPEHLGKIQIQVVSKDGVMTARIAAETETARQAIENGISNLKDAMEQQDLKVDAIEVMVSTAGFGKSGEEQNMEQQQKSSKSGRHLDFSDIEDEDSLEDTAEMEKMRAVGSSVSYTA